MTETAQLVTLSYFFCFLLFSAVAASITQCTGANIAMFNPELVEFLEISDPTTTAAQKKLLKKLTELHTCCMCKASLEGSGHIRYTETVSALFTNVSAFDKRYVLESL